MFLLVFGHSAMLSDRIRIDISARKTRYTIRFVNDVNQKVAGALEMCPRTAALLRTSLMRHGMTGNLSITRQKAHRLNKGAVLVISSLY